MRAAVGIVLASAACSGGDGRAVIALSASAVGAEGQLLARQARRFEAASPGLRVEVIAAPDAGDQRHQLYVTWLNAGVESPDLLQLDVIWVSELAAAGWLLPIEPAGGDPLPAAAAADRWAGQTWARAWFVDAGMLYWRTDRLARAPESLEALAEAAAARGPDLPYGFVWEGARYEGLVAVYLEYLGGFGGEILDAAGAVRVEDAAGAAALGALRGLIDSGASPRDVLTWHEEEARLAFQNGGALFLRSWPYAYALLEDGERSRVAGRFAVAPMPAARSSGGRPTATLGGGHLAINARSRHPREALALLEYLTAPAQLLERARVAGQYPADRALYAGGLLDGPLPPERIATILSHAVPRPVTPVYSELSEALQIHLHAALSGQVPPARALRAAAEEMRALLADAAPGARPSSTPRDPATAAPAGGASPAGRIELVGLGAVLVAVIAAALWIRHRRAGAPGRERGALLLLPAVLVVAGLAVLPVGWTVWESLHRHDLRMPWRGRAFVGLENYREILASGRFWGALGRTGGFTAASVSLELVLGLAAALVLARPFRGRQLARAATLIPWALSPVVAALVFRFLFEGEHGLVNGALAALGVRPLVWFAEPWLAWGPIVLAEVWKTTPFVALILAAGLESLDPALDEAARVDGASAWTRLFAIKLPLLRPAIAVALVFRAIDAIRIFDLIYAMTGGGPGTRTEPIALLAYGTLLDHLRFGRGAALSVLVFAATALLALIYRVTRSAEP